MVLVYDGPIKELLYKKNVNDYNALISKNAGVVVVLLLLLTALLYEIELIYLILGEMYGQLMYFVHVV